jgi:hypothetical protein
MKIALAVAAAAANKVAQSVDVQIGRDRDERYDKDRRQQFDRQRFNAHTTVGIGPGGITHRPAALPHRDYYE